MGLRRSLRGYWRAECTHVCASRVLDTERSFCCVRCGFSKKVRWVYVCTEDEDRALSDGFIRGLAETGSDLPSEAQQQQEFELPLNDWMSKAIADGHYTEEEVATLKQQRAAVLEGMRMSTRREKSARCRAEQICSHVRDAVNEIISEHCGPVVPECRRVYCLRCRPNYHERAWQSLNGLCSENNELLLEKAAVGQPASIFDIPMSEIRRPLPRPEPPRNDKAPGRGVSSPSSTDIADIWKDCWSDLIYGKRTRAARQDEDRPKTPDTETPGTKTPETETPETETPETETPETETPETETPETETPETPERPPERPCQPLRRPRLVRMPKFCIERRLPSASLDQEEANTPGEQPDKDADRHGEEDEITEETQN
ncbi:hypothetical protein TEQG_03337 [Trichophyton equinum CBS 127.97]|uniref:Uncharacterized protein n=1 Tax=Trichophyton equinum (strain ATCC MYA-4606 / CBS 127.97) TaxID=559882 RepID=F2PQY9_TRIEC|nr:hypothetical protein TEQG_03337 [Trichophyton equinum CBS 127.97]